jgi:glutamyl-tRNA reductase
MQLQVIGLNHKTASVEEREEAILLFRRLPGILLATCNRVEIYTENIINHKGSYYYRNEAAVQHLFRVASGLDSQILGETEVLGQVKEVFLRSKGKHWLLDQLFEKGIEVGRRVRLETGISKGSISIASVAIKKGFASLEQEFAKIVLIGAGKLTESILKTLLKREGSIVCVANRTFEKARKLTDRFGGRTVHFNGLIEELKDTDLVISSTAAPHLILREKHIESRKKPLTIIDLAVPRDVDPAVSKILGVKLLSIDDIKEEINLNLVQRQIEAVFAERIIKEEVKKFCEKYASALVAAV